VDVIVEEDVVLGPMVFDEKLFVVETKWNLMHNSC
jgi:hypothetical protein